MKNKIVWIVTVLMSALIIFLGSKNVSKDLQLFIGTDTGAVVAKVEEIIDTEVTSQEFGGKEYQSEVIRFSAKIIKGERKGEEVTGVQRIDDMYAVSKSVKKTEVNDRVILIDNGGVARDMQFVDHYRIDKIAILAGVFFALLLLIGKKKGLNTIISLIFTVLFIFMVFVPSVMNGFNIYISVALTCIYIIVMTLIILNGVGKKTWVTMAGCTSGVVMASLITYIMSQFLNITGYIDEHALYLSTLNPDHPIDLVAIIFSAIILGAMGAIMDVAMDISSSLYEITEHAPDISFYRLFKSGMTIGGDIMGTMANTLVLAYIGSSLATIILLFTYSSGIMHLLNREIVVIELLQALTGSLAILLTVPFTVLISGMVYLRKRKQIH